MSKKTGNWYIARGENWLGPYDHATVVTEIRKGNISWVDFGWNPSRGATWVRLCNVAEFQSRLPPEPSQELRAKLWKHARDTGADQEHEQAPRAAAKSQTWYLQFEGSEFGPLNVTEVEGILRNGKLNGHLSAWREGMEQWTPIHQIEELRGVVQSAGIPLSEQRRHQRIPFVATVRFMPADGKAVSAMAHTGVSRDISEGGMLIFSSSPSGGVGTILWVVINPVTETGLPPFEAEAEVVRLTNHEGNEGFAVRFTTTNERALAPLRKYILRKRG